MLKKKDPRGDLGKWAEGKANAWLKTKSEEDANLAFHRYPDARAARGALAAQPCDFLVAWQTITTKYVLHLEVKETTQERRLPRTRISQYGMLLKFHWAGLRTLVVVYRSAFNDWTYFTAKDLFGPNCEELKSFPFVEGRSFPTIDDLLNHKLDL